ncbi:MAG: hypothetical protein K2I06_04390 [Ruminococcus sp.]|nr:hypothetical protein [Ruminococcus sp.]
MNALNQLARNILDNGNIISVYESVNSENKDVSAFEVSFDENVLLLIFDDKNRCTGIILK